MITKIYRDSGHKNDGGFTLLDVFESTCEKDRQHTMRFRHDEKKLIFTRLPLNNAATCRIRQDLPIATLKPQVNPLYVSPTIRFYNRSFGMLIVSVPVLLKKKKRMGSIDIFVLVSPSLNLYSKSPCIQSRSEKNHTLWYTLRVYSGGSNSKFDHKPNWKEYKYTYNIDIDSFPTHEQYEYTISVWKIFITPRAYTYVCIYTHIS